MIDAGLASHGQDQDYFGTTLETELLLYFEYHAIKGTRSEMYSGLSVNSRVVKMLLLYAYRLPGMFEYSTYYPNVATTSVPLTLLPPTRCRNIISPPHEAAGGTP